MKGWRWWGLGKQLRSIKLLVLDVDGVLTDGGLWFDASGQLIKRFDVRDGLGIHLLRKVGVEIVFLSGGQGGATEVRARQLGVQHCLVGIKDKHDALLKLQQQLGLNVAETAFVGDDLNDLAVRPVVGLLIAPADACAPVLQAADAVLTKRGGYGAVRELAETILQARGHWQKLKRDGWRDRND
jgi:3-deoxy-D-manno-octulosonate 8-phosphate phosphatase (KDO 8-P phosphatase)